MLKLPEAIREARDENPQNSRRIICGFCLRHDGCGFSVEELFAGPESDHIHLAIMGCGFFTSVFVFIFVPFFARLYLSELLAMAFLYGFAMVLLSKLIALDVGIPPGYKLLFVIGFNFSFSKGRCAAIFGSIQNALKRIVCQWTKCVAFVEAGKPPNRTNLHEQRLRSARASRKTSAAGRPLKHRHRVRHRVARPRRPKRGDVLHRKCVKAFQQLCPLSGRVPDKGRFNFDFQFGKAHGADNNVLSECCPTFGFLLDAVCFMNGPPKPRRFQVHLSTAVLLMFVAGVLLWSEFANSNVQYLESS